MGGPALSMFRTLRDHDGTPLVALDKDELEMDGFVDSEGEIPDDQPMHIQRLSDGAWLVRGVTEDGIPELPEMFR